MLLVIYSMSVSLDGFIAGPDGDISWTASDAELFCFHIEQTRPSAAHLCGRGLTKRCWCGRPPSRPCPTRRTWSSPESGDRSLRWCSPARCIRCRATRGWQPTTSAPRSPDSVTSRAWARWPSAGRPLPQPPSPKTYSTNTPVRQPGHPRRRQPVPHAAHQTPRSAADRVPDLQLRRRLPSLPAHALSLPPVTERANNSSNPRGRAYGVQSRT